MEFILGYDKFEDIKSNAYWSRVHIDTRLVPDADSMNTYKAHLTDCNNHPTTGLLARRKYITSKPMNYRYHAKSNLSIMKLHPKILELEKTFKDKLNELYPKTKHIREYIINNDRVELDTIKRVKKYSILNKASIYFKKLF